jgi:hypothetical protein
MTKEQKPLREILGFDTETGQRLDQNVAEKPPQEIQAAFTKMG